LKILRIALLSVVPIGLLAIAPGLASAEAVEAITLPSADVTLSFVRAGRIAEVLVKEGDAVEAGQVLVRQDDEAERIQLEQLKVQAEDTTRIEAAEAQLAQKQEDLKKLEWAQKEGAATDWEVRRARLEVRIGELSLRLARFEHEQDGRKFAETKAQIDRMRLTSPVAGKVEEVAVETGEAVEPLAPVVRVVKTNPLWVNVPVPLAQARELKRGCGATVTFSGPVAEEGKGITEGRVIHVAAVADAASDTLTVRVEVPNVSSRPAGERVAVAFLPAAEPPVVQEGGRPTAGSKEPVGTKE